MDWYEVLPLMAGALSERGYLAIVGGRGMNDVPWVEGLNEIIPAYSTNKDYESFDLLDELERRRLFSVVGRRRTAPQEYRMSVNRYVEMFPRAQRLFEAAHGRAIRR